MPMKVLIPTKLAADGKAMRRAIKNGLDAAAKGATVDFNVTAQTWRNKPGFETDASADDRRIVGTSDQIYDWVNNGTQPHVIVAKGRILRFNAGARTKTRPNAIGSTSGGGGTPVVARRVNHPGTRPRNFDKVIAKKWTDELPTTLQRAIDSEVS